MGIISILAFLLRSYKFKSVLHSLQNVRVACLVLGGNAGNISCPEDATSSHKIQLTVVNSDTRPVD